MHCSVTLLDLSPHDTADTLSNRDELVLRALKALVGFTSHLLDAENAAHKVGVAVLLVKSRLADCLPRIHPPASHFLAPLSTARTHVGAGDSVLSASSSTCGAEALASKQPPRRAQRRRRYVHGGADRCCAVGTAQPRRHCTSTSLSQRDEPPLPMLPTNEWVD